MSNDQLIEVILRREVSDIKYITNKLNIYLQNLEPQFVLFKIINSEGNIAERIQKETGFECYHKYPIQVMTASRGTNYIKIPVEEYTEELENKLKSKYES